MKECIEHVGLDVHKDVIAVSVAEAGKGEVRCVGQIANTPDAHAEREGFYKAVAWRDSGRPIPRGRKGG